MVIMANHRYWTPSERDEIIEAALDKHMSKKRKLRLDTTHFNMLGAGKKRKRADEVDSDTSDMSGDETSDVHYMDAGPSTATDSQTHHDDNEQLQVVNVDSEVTEIGEYQESDVLIDEEDNDYFDEDFDTEDIDGLLSDFERDGEEVQMVE